MSQLINSATVPESYTYSKNKDG